MSHFSTVSSRTSWRLDEDDDDVGAVSKLLRNRLSASDRNSPASLREVKPYGRSFISPVLNHRYRFPNLHHQCETERDKLAWVNGRLRDVFPAFSFLFFDDGNACILCAGGQQQRVDPDTSTSARSTVKTHTDKLSVLVLYACARLMLLAYFAVVLLLLLPNNNILLIPVGNESCRSIAQWRTYLNNYKNHEPHAKYTLLDIRPLSLNLHTLILSYSEPKITWNNAFAVSTQNVKTLKLCYYFYE